MSKSISPSTLSLFPKDSEATATSFSRPDDVEAVTPAQQRAMDFSEFDELRQRVHDMDVALATAFASGLVGTRSNTFQHRSRVLRQAREKLEQMRASLPEVAAKTQSSQEETDYEN